MNHQAATSIETVKNILLVDDDEVDVMAVQRLFRQMKMEEANYALYVAGDGGEALALLCGDERPPLKPRGILLDLNMPGMDGHEFLKQLRANAELRNTRVIILTASAAALDKRLANRLRVTDYIVKPITLAQFVNAITVFNS